MTDLHGLGGRTMSAGEAALRAKLKALGNAMLRLPGDDLRARTYGNAGQLIWDVLLGELDPRDEQVEL